MSDEPREGWHRLDQRNGKIFRIDYWDPPGPARGRSYPCIRSCTLPKFHKKVHPLGFNRVGNRTGKIQNHPCLIRMITQTNLFQHSVINRYEWLSYGRCHAWHVNHETSLIKTCHLMGQLAISREDHTQVVRATLNIYA